MSGLLILGGCLAGIVSVLCWVARNPSEPFGHIVTCTGIVTRELDPKCDKCRWLAARSLPWRS